MWADPDCTVRPVPGVSYRELTAKLGKSYGVDDYFEDGYACVLQTPTIDEPYFMLTVYVDWVSDEYDVNLLPKGSIITLTVPFDNEWPADGKVSFDPIT